MNIPFIRLSGQKTSAFTRHRRSHEYAAFQRLRAAKRKAGGSAMMADFATSGRRLTCDDYEIKRGLYFCCTCMESFLRVADRLVQTRSSRVDSFKGTHAASTLRRKMRDAVAPLRDQVLGEIAWNLVAKSSGRASLTMDGWTDVHMSQKYVAMTLHFPHLERYEMLSCCICAVAVDDGTARVGASAANTAFQRLMNCGRAHMQGLKDKTGRKRQCVIPIPVDFAERDIARMCSAMTADNAANAVLTAKLVLDGQRQIGCHAHSLELVLKDVCEPGKADSRNLWCDDSKDIREALHSGVAASRRLAAHFSRSQKSWECVLALPPSDAPKLVKPQPHVATRWGSTSVCMSSVLNVLPALEAWILSQGVPAAHADAVKLLVQNREFFQAAARILEVFRHQRDMLCRDS